MCSKGCLRLPPRRGTDSCESIIGFREGVGHYGICWVWKMEYGFDEGIIGFFLVWKVEYGLHNGMIGFLEVPSRASTVLIRAL